MPAFYKTQSPPDLLVSQGQSPSVKLVLRSQSCWSDGPPPGTPPCMRDSPAGSCLERGSGRTKKPQSYFALSSRSRFFGLSQHAPRGPCSAVCGEPCSWLRNTPGDRTGPRALGWHCLALPAGVHSSLAGTLLPGAPLLQGDAAGCCVALDGSGKMQVGAHPDSRRPSDKSHMHNGGSSEPAICQDSHEMQEVMPESQAAGH